jgi:hypothetical protein
VQVKKAGLSFLLALRSYTLYFPSFWILITRGFNMAPVEIIDYQGAVVIRARGSELIILPTYVHVLQNTTEPKEFANYFLTEALVNRPARKLFDSWLKKDMDLWKKIYNKIHKGMEKVNLEDNQITKALEKK